MEIANRAMARIRPALSTDSESLSALLAEAKQVHTHLDWHLPADWFGSPHFVVLESAQNGNGRLDACLAAVSDPAPGAWVRLAAVRQNLPLLPTVKAMTSRIIPELKKSGVNQLGWLDSEDWPEELFTELSYSRAHQIVTFCNYSLGSYPVVSSKIKLRAAQTKDIDELAEIEVAAFEPLWRHSATGLHKALRTSYSFDVAIIDKRIAGFQYSVRGSARDHAHLVRLTVRPDLQRQGIGSALLTNALDHFAMHGVRSVTLNTQLDNVRSHRLYERFGFSKTGDNVSMWVRAI